MKSLKQIANETADYVTGSKFLQRLGGFFALAAIMVGGFLTIEKTIIDNSAQDLVAEVLKRTNDMDQIAKTSDMIDLMAYYDSLNEERHESTILVLDRILENQKALSVSVYKNSELIELNAVYIRALRDSVSDYSETDSLQNALMISKINQRSRDYQDYLNSKFYDIEKSLGVLEKQTRPVYDSKERKVKPTKGILKRGKVRGKPKKSTEYDRSIFDW